MATNPWNRQVTRFTAFGALLCVSLFPAASRVAALEIPAGGVEITGTAALQAYINGANGKAESLANGGKRITVTQPDEAQPYVAQFAMPCPGAEIRKGERIFVVIRARVTEGVSGGLIAKLQLGEKPYRAVSPATEVDVYREWRDYPVLFLANDGLPKGKAHVVLLCGHKAQPLEVASIRVLRYPESMAVAAFPRLLRTYAGREADAPWRRAALERIERERKADLAATIVGADGLPRTNVEVRLTLRRHAFGFGSATPVKWYLDESENGRKWREIVDRYFSMVVFENDLKDYGWRADAPPARRAARNADLDKAFAWLGERHIAVRGHYLMQVAIPENLRGMKDAAIREHYLQATRERVPFVGERVCEWDVVNHPVAWGGADLLTARPGLEQLDRDVIALARTLTRLPLLVNEDQLYRPGRQSDGTYNYLKALAAAGVKIDGLGNQAHIHESFLPSPEDVLKMTDRFAKVVPRQVITEFDVVTTGDEDLAADYTRDLLIACFSHPAYSGFLWWGFWAGAHWRPEAASWNKDWSVRKRGEIIREWIGERWHTEVTVKTDANGVVLWRGFPGWYEAQAGAESFPMFEAKRK